MNQNQTENPVEVNSHDKVIEGGIEFTVIFMRELTRNAYRVLGKAPLLVVNGVTGEYMFYVLPGDFELKEYGKRTKGPL